MFSWSMGLLPGLGNMSRDHSPSPESRAPQQPLQWDAGAAISLPPAAKGTGLHGAVWAAPAWDPWVGRQQHL